MPNTICLTCPWCRSKSQTMEVWAAGPGRDAPGYMRSLASNAYYIGLICRRCKGFSSATIHALDTRYINAEASILRGSTSIDLTPCMSSLFAQSPKLQNTVSENVPESVREALADAYDAERPRARCSHFRTAVEFALREAKIDAKPGLTLGAILKDAQKSFALPPALLELCDQVKAFGNWGLHWLEAKVEQDDAEAAQEITEAIINYLFELPARVEAAKLRIEEAKATHHSA